mmetsp:Transcript_89889/g.254625  ORF Transcript_89889/g.254625 Transcript_89889/m.254625 type:complete len:130 (+) Transcript_89889:443-832(+)
MVLAAAGTVGWLGGVYIAPLPLTCMSLTFCHCPAVMALVVGATAVCPAEGTYVVPPALINTCDGSEAGLKAGIAIMDWAEGRYAEPACATVVAGSTVGAVGAGIIAEAAGRYMEVAAGAACSGTGEAPT